MVKSDREVLERLTAAARTLDRQGVIPRLPTRDFRAAVDEAEAHLAFVRQWGRDDIHAVDP